MNINPFDIFVVLLCLGTLFFSYARGLWANIASAGGTLLGFILALMLHKQGGAWLESVLPSIGVANLLAYLLLLSSGYFLGNMITNPDDDTQTNIWASLISALLAFCKGLTICLALYWIALNFITPWHSMMNQAYLSRYFYAALNAFKYWLEI